MYHNPVLLKECIAGLDINPAGIYVDVTFGGGGHSRAILEHLTTGHLYAFDQDEDAANNAFDDPRFTFIQQNFRFLKNFMQLHRVHHLDGILADLGVSSHQFDTPEKGFSTRYDGRLDMRMCQGSAVDAATVVNTYDVDALLRVMKNYGELQNAYNIVMEIVKAREVSPINTTAELREVVQGCLPRGRENKTLAQIFQALRIEVNNELEVLSLLLSQCAELLRPGGRLVVMSYHSLEDRLVKNYMKTGNLDGKEEKDFFGNSLSPYKLITRKPIMPTDEEVAVNNRARSARLRIAEKK